MAAQIFCFVGFYVVRKVHFSLYTPSQCSPQTLIELPQMVHINPDGQVIPGFIFFIKMSFSMSFPHFILHPSFTINEHLCVCFHAILGTFPLSLLMTTWEYNCPRWSRT